MLRHLLTGFQPQADDAHGAAVRDLLKADGATR